MEEVIRGTVVIRPFRCPARGLFAAPIRRSAALPTVHATEIFYRGQGWNRGNFYGGQRCARRGRVVRVREQVQFESHLLEAQSQEAPSLDILVVADPAVGCGGSERHACESGRSGGTMHWAGITLTAP